MINIDRLLNGIDVFIIDEAQAVSEIGLCLKPMVDSIENIRIIATGSSQFDLNNELGEPLVGRKNTLQLFPFSHQEFAENERFSDTQNKLEERLIFGSYPGLYHIHSWSEKEQYMKELVQSYLLKDILIFDGVRNSSKIYDLLRLIAYQVGKEVSLQELGKQLSLSKNTVERYLDLLTKVFVLRKVEGFHRNLRKEITKTSRWYFFDVGVRNCLINNFNRLENRTDVGELWENYLIAKRIKRMHYMEDVRPAYFWRTYDQQEIDWIETKADDIWAYEFMWSPNKKVKIPGGFAKAYPDASYEIIDKANHYDFIEYQMKD